MMRASAAGVVFLAAFSWVGSAGAAGLEQAVAQSRQTGLPLLVVVTSDT